MLGIYSVELDSTWIHSRPRNRSRTKFNKEKTFSATERTVVAVYARSSATERQFDWFREWLSSNAVIHKNLLDRNKFQSRDKPKTSTFASNAEESSKPKSFECPFKDGQHPIWTCKNSNQWKWMNDASKSRSSDCVSRRILQKLSQMLNITQGGLPVVRIKLTNRDSSPKVLAMFDSVSSIPFVDKSVVSKLQLQGRKVSLSVAGIHGSQDVKTEIVPIAVSEHEKFRPFTTVQFYKHEKLMLTDQIVKFQELTDR